MDIRAGNELENRRDRGDNHIRLLQVIATLVYIGTFHYMYIEWLFPLFGYFGFKYEFPGWGYVVLSYTLATIPSLYLPTKLSLPSTFLNWIIYVMVYIPSQLVPMFQNYQSHESVTVYMFTLFGGMTFMIWISGKRGFKFPEMKINSKIFWIIFGVMALALTTWVLVAFGDHMRWPSLEDIYDQRAKSAEVIGDSLLGYATAILSGAINPFLMAYGLSQGKKVPFILGAGGQVFLYLTAAMKGILLSVIIIPLIFILIRRYSQRIGVAIMGYSVMLVSLTLFFLSGYDDDIYDGQGNWIGQLGSLIFVRIFGMSGLLSGWYHDFFSQFPLTYFTQITVLSKIFKYPYQMSLGEEVGAFYMSKGLDANAHFWASDGLSSGIVGVVIISILAGLLFWIINAVSRKHDLTFATLTFAFAVINLCNASLFTCLLSGGIILLLTFLFFFPSTSRKHIL